MTTLSIPSENFIHALREEFRTHLENLYSHLHLAPPYHSIEKAIQLLGNALRTKSEHFPEMLTKDSRLKWDFFREIFVSSGLNRKHRGIIEAFLKTQIPGVLSQESLQFLQDTTDFQRRPAKISGAFHNPH